MRNKHKYQLQKREDEAKNLNDKCLQVEMQNERVHREYLSLKNDVERSEILLNSEKERNLTKMQEYEAKLKSLEESRISEKRNFESSLENINIDNMELHQKHQIYEK